MKFEEDESFNIMLRGFIRSSAYLAGLYYSNSDETNDNFFSSVYGYIIIMVMLIVEKYFQNKCYEFYKSETKIEKMIKNRKKLVKINNKNKFVNNEEGVEKQINLDIMEDKNKLTKIENFKQVNDPLSLIINENENKMSNRFITNLNNFFEDSDNNLRNENNKIIQNISLVKSSTRTLSISDFIKPNNQIHEDVIKTKELKEEFSFPNFFENPHSDDDSLRKTSSDLTENNKIIQNENIEKEVEINLNPNINILDLNENKLEEKSQKSKKSQNSEEEIEIKTRTRKNAYYKKQLLLKYSLEFQSGIKKFLEEVILFLILLSAILKLNILSFVYFIIVVITYKSGNKLKSIFYLASIYLFLFIIQYALFTSNLSNFTDTNPNLILLKDLKEFLNLPWYYTTFGYKWGLFFSLGVTKYQINSLWIDLIIIIFIYFYLEYFSFAIFEMRLKENSNKIIFSEFENSYKRISNFSQEEYEKFKKSMKVSYDIEIQKTNFTHKKEKINDNNFYRNFILKKYKGRNPIEREKNKNNLLTIYKTFKRYIYLTFHNVTLIIIFIFSMMNNGVISIVYIIFSVVYIYKTHNFLVGNQWTFQHAIKYLLKPILFIDLICQLIYQIPFEYFIIHRNSLNGAMSILGFEVLINYNTPSALLNIKSFSLTFLKIVTYFLVSIQEIIYNSNDFKTFIVKYHLKQKEKTKFNGQLHSFIFNNSRIILMNERLKERREIDDTLNKIELQLNKWNEKLHFNPNNDTKNNTKITTNISRKRFTRQRNISVGKREILGNFKPKISEKKILKKVDDISLKKILNRNWLINLSIYLHDQSTLLFGHSKDNSMNVERILKGYMNVRSELEELIEKFESENEDKYLILKKIRKEKFSRTSMGDAENEDLKRKSNLSNLSENDKLEVIEENEEEIDNNQENNENKENKENKDNINPFIKKNSAISTDTNILLTELKNEDQEEFLESSEYFELREAIVNNFFEYYCSYWKIIKYIILDILKYFAQNFEYICYFFMILNHMAYCSLLSLIWPLLVFCAGLINYPRPRKSFWKLSIIYSSFVICFKFILQLTLWTLFFDKKVEPDEFGSFNYKDYWRIGIQLFNSTFSYKFLNYIIYDFILLSVLLAHQFMLIRKGLWNVIETDLESVESANDRINQNNIKTSFIKISNEKELNNNKINKSSSFLDKIKKYYDEIFPRMRNEKPGKDFYVGYTISQMFILFFIIFFYTKMDQDTTVYNEETIKLKQFSGNMVIFSFIHVFLVVLERYIYLKNLRKIKNIKYKIYDTFTGREILEENTRDKDHLTLEEIEDLKSYEENERYEVVYFQYESLQMGLIYKYILQIILVIFIHFYIFWYFPIRGNINLHNSSICELDLQKVSMCNEFKDNILMKLFYILYCIYFFFSGLQIRYSMIDLRKQSSLMKGDNLFYSSVFKTFKAIPFLYELKLLIDWTFTITSLDLWKWLKFEAIYDLLFITKCNMKSYYGRRLGSKVTNCDKFFSGGLFFFLLIIIVFGPLVLFSSLNPTNKSNLVTGAKVELQLTLVKENIALNFTLFKSSQVASIMPITDIEWNKNKFNETVETKNYDKEQVQVVRMLSSPERVWDIPEDTYRFILNSLEKKSEYDVYFNLKYSFTRQLTTSSNFYVSSYRIYTKNDTKSDSTIVKSLIDAFKECNYRRYETGFIFNLDKFYNPAIRLSQSETPSRMSKDNFKQNGKIFFFCMTDQWYWTLEGDNIEGEGITFYTFSDLVSPTSAQYDVLTFYVTFILIIGKFVRSIISGEAERVIYTEMPRPHKLLKLCEGIKISRYKQDLEREDKLFYILIDLMRSPEMLRMITKSSLQFTSTLPNYNLSEINSKTNKNEIIEYKKRNKVLFY